MKVKLGIFLTVSYFIAFSLNLVPSIKHPDSTMNSFNLLAASLFLIALLTAVKKGSIKGIKLFLIGGFVSGLVVYVFKLMEDTLMSHAVLDVIAAIQYPVYLLFITPLFGMNYLFDISYGRFSLLMAGTYGLIFLAVTGREKLGIQNVSLH